jgi:hypothetical protein
MLVLIVLVFLLTEMPSGLINLAAGIGTGSNETLYIEMGEIIDLLALINNSVNFILYCTMSAKFREQFFQTFFIGATRCNNTRNDAGARVTVRQQSFKDKMNRAEQPLLTDGVGTPASTRCNSTSRKHNPVKQHESAAVCTATLDSTGIVQPTGTLDAYTGGTIADSQSTADMNLNESFVLIHIANANNTANSNSYRAASVVRTLTMETGSHTGRLQSRRHTDENTV